MSDYEYELGEYERGFEHGFQAGKTTGFAQQGLLDDALGELTHLMDQIEVLKHQLNLATTDDLE